LGDSLTEGDYGPLTSYGGRRFENYPYYLAQLTGASTTNFGRCGASSTSYLNEYYNAGHIDITESDVILLMLGTNKGLADGSEYYTDYETLVDKILADKKPEAILVLIAPPSATTDPNKINYGYMDSITSANETVRALAEKKGLHYIDALKTSPIQPETEEIYQDFDGLHMNQEGYAAFAKYIAEELAKILG
jgi:lysophospholipase L1-like esterase